MKKKRKKKKRMTSAGIKARGVFPMLFFSACFPFSSVPLPPFPFYFYVLQLTRDRREKKEEKRRRLERLLVRRFRSPKNKNAYLKLWSAKQFFFSRIFFHRTKASFFKNCLDALIYKQKKKKKTSRRFNSSFRG